MQILNSANIDMASNTVTTYLSKEKVDSKDVLRIRLSVEEVLLKYYEKFGDQISFTLISSKRFRTPHIELRIACDSMEPFGDDDNYGIMENLLSNYGLAPVWRYKRGKNIIIFTAKKKQQISQVLQLGISIVLALISGFLCKLLPANISKLLITDLIAPLSDTFMGLMSAIAGPIVFLSVLCGICSLGDMATMGKIGKKMIGRFLLGSFIVGMIGVLICLPFFAISSSGTASVAFADLYQMVLDIIPHNFFTPFIEGNSLQIVFIAFAIGLTMLFLGNQISQVTGLLNQLNTIMQVIMSTVSSFIPFFVFSSILNLIVNDNISMIGRSYKLILVMVLEGFLLMLFYALLVCFKKHVNLFLLLKKLAPTFVIGLTTASSVAAFQTNINVCETKLGIDKKLVDIGIPLGQVIFMPGAIILFLCAAFGMGEAFGIAVTPIWILTAFIISVILAIAAPPIPGAALTCYTILFLQLGIPREAIAVIIALNVILEFLATAINLFCLQCEMVELSGSLNLLDTDCLRH